MSEAMAKGLGLASGAALPLRPLQMEPCSEDEARPGYRLRLCRPHRSDPILTALFAALVCLFAGAVVFGESYDNDVWFFLATGEWIAEHGIPYANPFSIHPDMGFIAQQWLHCLISYLIYSASGFVGLGAWCVVLFLALAASLFCLGMKLRASRTSSEVVMLFVAASVIGVSAYASVRPHLYSMLAFTWIIWVCESYRRCADKRLLVALPLIVVLHVNLHAAIAPFDLFIIACYCIPDIPALFHARGKLRCIELAGASYPRIPLLIALVACVLALFINPYGWAGACYVFLSFGSAAYKNRINEMGSFVPAAGYLNILVTVIMLVAICAIGRMGAKRIDLPLGLLCIVCIAGAMAFTRNQWMGALMSGIYLMWASRRCSLEAFPTGRAAKAAASCLVLAGVVGMGAFMMKEAPELASYPEDGPNTPVSTMEYLDSLDVDADATKVFTFFNAGGYIEFCGYKVNIDPRPEIWNAQINGQGKDYYYEYVEMSTANMPFSRYNEKYDFDVFVIDSTAGTDPYFEDDPDYVEIPGGPGYRSWAKKSWIDQYETS